MGDGAGEQGARGAGPAEIAAHRQLLSHADLLEVHPEDRRNGRRLRPIGGLAVDLVDDRLNFGVVVGHHRRHAGGVVVDLLQRERVRGPVAQREAPAEIDAVDDAAVDDERVDLRRVEVVDPLAGRPIDQVVRLVLVGPGRVAARLTDHLEHRVDLEELVGEDRLAVPVRVEAHRQVARIDGAEDLREVLGEDFEVRALRAGGTLAVAARREQRAVVAVVVIDAGGLWATAGHEGRQPGE